MASSCSLAQHWQLDAASRLRDASELVEQVKTFAQTLGIQSTDSLRRSIRDREPVSMLWLWLQREGRLALRDPIDIRVAIGFHGDRERIPLERVYRINGYSVYYRQGNEFADARAVVTPAFAGEGVVRQVKVVVHEELHDDKNFALPWEIEESLVTPLGSLIAVEFFKHRGDHENLTRALASLEEERRFSRELNALAAEADKLFRDENLAEAKKRILALLPSYPIYFHQFQRQIAGQNSATALEAKLSHDLAYFRDFDNIVELGERAQDLKTLIEDLKKLPQTARHEELELYLQELKTKYSAPGF